MAELPMGIATFLFTDLAGSTRLWEHSPEAMKGRGGAPRRCSAVHRGGHAMRTTGDGIHAVFPSGQSAFRPRACRTPPCIGAVGQDRASSVSKTWDDESTTAGPW